MAIIAPKIRLTSAHGERLPVWVPCGGPECHHTFGLNSPHQGLLSAHPPGHLPPKVLGVGPSPAAVSWVTGQMSNFCVTLSSSLSTKRPNKVFF